MTKGLFDDMPRTTSASPLLIAYCDGGSRGNPGPAGFGAVIEDEKGNVVARLSEFLGKRTNNYAEYSGMIAVLTWAVENKHRRLRVVADSELMVKQMQGKYKVNSPDLRPLWEKARELTTKLDRFEIQHTLRGGNKEADALANEAMDRGMGRVPAVAVSSTPAAGAARPGTAQAPARPQRERIVLDGFVKDGVVHLLGGELPDGTFVKIVRE